MNFIPSCIHRNVTPEVIECLDHLISYVEIGEYFLKVIFFMMFVIGLTLSSFSGGNCAHIPSISIYMNISVSN